MKKWSIILNHDPLYNLERVDVLICRRHIKGLGGTIRYAAVNITGITIDMLETKAKELYDSVFGDCSHEGCVLGPGHEGLHSLTKPYSHYKQGPIKHQMAAPGAIPKYTKGDTHRFRDIQRIKKEDGIKDVYDLKRNRVKYK
jgi:hypothetical protein